MPRIISKNASETVKPHLHHASILLFYCACFRSDDPAEIIMFNRDKGSSPLVLEAFLACVFVACLAGARKAYFTPLARIIAVSTPITAILS
jgi:hypothetical protein